MSRHTVVTPKKIYTYGFDACVPEYFLMSMTSKGNKAYLVGEMSNLSGTAGNLLRELGRLKLVGLVPQDHINFISMDLPIPQGEHV